MKFLRERCACTASFRANQKAIAALGKYAIAFIKCEKYNFDLLDDGIYYHDQKLGGVGCTDGRWWLTYLLVLKERGFLDTSLGCATKWSYRPSMSVYSLPMPYGDLFLL
ncbi:hypothetical protein [aff. Roholtiella sp. LEGE 12411]|uniref:hypothetical protein n=1 Tax=aff. Roholtiella sp. LEGE 12411 TaxID=1828822 RepID=UPI00187EA294|nr:hypothetical protein [aff. Roholtiella sp. LEGE 12411]MBE9036041.1 hypothetical protein [aff. Roholtiella sp. LEGE 12411]